MDFLYASNGSAAAATALPTTEAIAFTGFDFSSGHGIYTSTSAFKAVYKPQIEALWSFLIYLPLIATSAAPYFSARGKRKAKILHFPYKTLLSHITIGLCQVTFYYTQQLRHQHVVGITPALKPTILDTLAGLVFAWGALSMTRTIRGRNSMWIRTAFQSGALYHLSVVVLAWYFESAAFHRATVKNLNAFVYARWIIIGLLAAKISKNVTLASGIGLVLGFFLCAWEGDLSWSMPSLCALAMATVLLTKYVSVKIDNAFPSKANPVVEALAWAGICDPEISMGIRGEEARLKHANDRQGGAYGDESPDELGDKIKKSD